MTEEVEKLRRVADLAEQRGDKDLALKAMRRLKSIKDSIEPEFGVNLIRNLNQGLLLGFGDEVEAGLNAAKAAIEGQDINEAFSQNLKQIRQQRQEFASESPKTAFTAEVAGSIVPGALGGASLAAKLPMQVSPAVRAAMAAAPAGAVAGAGAADPSPELSFADSLQDRIDGALTGSAAAAAFGAATPVVGRAIKGAAGGAASAVRSAAKGGQTKALKVIAKAMDRDSLNIDQLMRRKSILGPEATLADLGDENIAGLLEEIGQQPGFARNKVKGALIGRLQGQRGRLKDVVRDNVHPKAENLAEARTALETELSQRAKPIYDRALSSAIEITPEISEVLQTPKVKPLVNKAIALATSDPNLSPALKQGLNPDKPNMVLLDYTKKAIDDRILKTKGNERRIFTALKNKLVKGVDKKVPAYKEARAVWGDGAQQLEALELGQDIFKEAKKGVGNVDAVFKNMSVSEQEMFKLGAANEMMRVMDNVADTLEGRPASAVISKIYSSPAQKQAVKAVLGDGRSIKAFERAIDAEKKFINISNRVLSNSATVKRLAQQADGVLDINDAADIAQGRIPALSQILKKLSDKADLGEKTRSDLAKRLTSADAGDIKATLIAAKRQGSVIPSRVETALNLDNASLLKWIRKNPDRINDALARSVGITAGVEVNE